MMCNVCPTRERPERPLTERCTILGVHMVGFVRLLRYAGAPPADCAATTNRANSICSRRRRNYAVAIVQQLQLPYQMQVAPRCECTTSYWGCSCLVWDALAFAAGSSYGCVAGGWMFTFHVVQVGKHVRTISCSTFGRKSTAW